MNDSNTANILSLLDNYVFEDAHDVAMSVAESFRKRRVEKNITRQRISELSGVPLSTVARFEQKGLIAFESLIKIAKALGYTSEIRSIFDRPKFETMQELDEIRKHKENKRAYVKSQKK